MQPAGSPSALDRFAAHVKAVRERETTLSQKALAARMKCSERTVLDMENGKRLPQRQRLYAWEQAIGTHPEAWELYREAEQERDLNRLIEHVLDDHASGIQGAEALHASCWAVGIDEACQVMPELWLYDPGDPPVTPHDAAAVSVVTLRWLVAPRDAIVSRLEGRRRIGQRDIERVRAVRRRLKAIDDAHGGGAAFPMAVTYLRGEVKPILACASDGTTLRSFLEATAEIVLDVGWMAYDAGDQGLARRYLMQALRLAHAAENRLLGGRILAAVSHQALHLNEVLLGIDTARAARAGTGRVGTPKATAMLAAMEACAQAANKDASLCTTALLDAERALSRVGSGDEEPEWLDFDEGGLWGHAARAYRDLGRAKLAEQCAERSIALCRSDHSRTRAQRNTILATAHLQLGNVDHASTIGSRVVEYAWDLHSGHVLGEVALLVRAIEPTKSTAANDFLEQAHEKSTAANDFLEQAHELLSVRGVDASMN